MTTVNISAEMVKKLREQTGAAFMACKKALTQSNGDLAGAVEILRKAGAATAAKRADKIAAEGSIVIALSDDKKKACMVELNSETDFVARDAHFGAFAKAVAMCGLTAETQNIEALLQQPLAAGSKETVEAARQGLISKMGENIKLRRVVFLESDGIVGHYCHGNRIGVLVSIDKPLPELAKEIAMHIAAFDPRAIGPDDLPKAMVEKEREILLAQVADSGKPREIMEKMVSGRLTKFLKEITLLGQPFFKDSEKTIEALLKPHHVTIKQFIRFAVGEGIEKETRSFADEVMAQVKGNE